MNTKERTNNYQKDAYQKGINSDLIARVSIISKIYP